MSVSYDFAERTVIVTGGSSGIGRAAARLFGDAGATVVVADVREEPKDLGEETPTHEAVADAGGTAEYVETDVSDPDDVASVVEAARAHGGVDVMVNNAGLQIPNPLGDVSPGDLGDMLDVNVKGVFYGVQAAAADMIDRDDPGVILNTASISSNLAQRGQIPYDATKGAVRMVTRGAALELGEYGIRVNAVAPGQIATEFAQGWNRGGEREKRERRPAQARAAGTGRNSGGRGSRVRVAGGRARRLRHRRTPPRRRRVAGGIGSARRHRAVPTLEWRTGGARLDPFRFESPSAGVAPHSPSRPAASVTSRRGWSPPR